MVKIGIPLRYNHMSDGRCILYLSERLRRTMQKAGTFIVPIVQVQDLDYMDTKYTEFPELTDDEKKIIDDYLDMVDGVLFPGGIKISLFDRYLLDRCVERNIPVLGICLGMQLLSSYKHDFKMIENDSNINHRHENDEELTHKVSIVKDSLLYKIINKDEIKVNSFHRYHVGECPNCIVNAYSEDGFIEGIERGDGAFFLGIQWHPEISYEFDEDSRKIIDTFIKVCEGKSLEQ